ncbi:PadR family transcriptional regulator [Alkalibaculum sp. M08DMB]|uniref:PadR family transcriptional regulator n=1 Tax=Alkalibaculum sporogenes TaxID=2655001 RepID=A0A6A7K762_9FIRM|nr:PadR family transcriptional regulator [Alkalibaculum sporogenes]MPW25225.1 PadR family transcriptional regulator [Alkalibaculum sporogenes]
MAIDKSLLTGGTTMLLLKLLEQEDMYGYQMIEELKKKSKNVFELKAGTLYPLLHTMEKKGFVNSYDEEANNSRIRKYYSITKAGKQALQDKKDEWQIYAATINDIIGGVSFAY